jgi:nucleotide-binding universal stress UspA family protein
MRARTAAADRLNPGELIDDFLVWERLHVGAQGILYRVTGPETGFPMLMKVPRFVAGDDGSAVVSYEMESMILPVLSGPHVPRFVAAGDLRRVPYIVQERVDGESLETLLEDAPLDPDEVVRIGAAIADALHAIHRQDVVHCDLKPDNILIKDSGEAVLIDFGLAWHARFPDLLAEEERHTAGSTPYISPEQLLGVRGDPRSDVFSLGAILYELATGELPFGIPITDRETKRRLWDDPDPPAMLNKHVTPVLQEIILRCLEPKVEKRYQSAAHVAIDLRNPGQVQLTERAFRQRNIGFLARTKKRWLASVRPLEAEPVRRPLDLVPVIMVAVDTTHVEDERQPAIQRETRRMLALSDEFRLVCVSVVAAPPPGAPPEDQHLEHMKRLRNWTAPLALPENRLSLHVLIAADPPAALVEFAQRNNADLIILGAPRPRQQAFAWWRSVASGVTAHAHCTVHVVRVPERAPRGAVN